jgi:Mitochondrial carrier protein
MRRQISLTRAASLVAFLWMVVLQYPSDTASSKQASSCYSISSSLFAHAKEVEEVDQDGFIRRRLYKSKKPATNSPVVPLAPPKPLTLNEIFIKAGKHGLGGGIPGFIAGIIQVFTLMWMRTIINYQCRYGTTFRQALRILLREGGIRRLYRGISFALVQAPLARFVGTAANDGVESLLNSLESTKTWGPGRSTIVASFVVGIWRMLLMRK